MNKKQKLAPTIRSSAAEYLTFLAASGDGGVEAIYADENIWLTQKMMGVLYDVETHTINYHLQKIFSDSELEEDAVIRNFRITASDGKNYDTKHYHLAAIIAVGYKVNSERAVQFRKWATSIIQEYTIKAYVMDDDRLKNDGPILGKKYFEEQLERIREIRLSERFIRKLPTSTPPQLTTMSLQQPPNDFLPPCKTNCTGQFTAKLLPKSFTPVLIPNKPIWA